MPERRSRRAARDEVKVCGLNAVLALAEHRIEDVIRVQLVEPRLRELSEVLRWCAAHRKAYRVVPAEELDRIAETMHHEGVCVLAKQLPALDLAGFVAGAPAGPSGVVVLENVQNPHNLGALFRVAAHFGASTIMTLNEGPGPELSTAVYRTAEGGVESVQLVRADRPKQALAALRSAGYTVLATSGHAGRSIYAEPLPARAAVLLGAEGPGLSRALLEGADAVVSVPGTGQVESLNVATAGAAILGEYFRLHRAPRQARSRGSGGGTTGRERDSDTSAPSAPSKTSSAE